MPAARLRIMTYNVHRCVGRDGRLSPSRIAAAIAEQKPDVVALQELDIGRARTEFGHQVKLIAEALEMSWFFHPAFQVKDEHFGDAILSRLPMRLVRSAILPTLPNSPGLERRGALWVAVAVGDMEVQFITTHLGLFPREQIAQVEALLGAEWIGHELCRPPFVLLGDLNIIPGSRPYRRLRARLHDPFPWGGWPLGTFPARYPILRIDHVLVSPNCDVRSMSIPRTKLTRMASDHLPVVVEASFTR